VTATVQIIVRVSNPIPNVQPTYVHPGGYALNNYRRSYFA
jgi:hypothetical protein